MSSHHFCFHSDDDDDDDEDDHETVVSPIIINIQPPSPAPSPSLLLSSSVMITTMIMTIIRTRALLLHSDPSQANHRLIDGLNQQFLVFFIIVFTEFGIYREGGLKPLSLSLSQLYRIE